MSLALANTLAYYDTTAITVVKTFIVLGPGAIWTGLTLLESANITISKTRIFIFLAYV
jgi:hypothetical protein